MCTSFLKRLLPMLISVALVLGVFPAFAATQCCDPEHMTMQMSVDSQTTPTDQHKNIPSKMPAEACAAMCVSMASVALVAPQASLFAPIATGELSWFAIAHLGGISDPPALPPPITRI